MYFKDGCDRFSQLETLDTGEYSMQPAFRQKQIVC